MPKQTANNILNQVNELLATKRAKYEEEKSGMDTPVESFPGAERNTPDTSDQSPDQEAANRTERSLEGAGDDSPKTRGHAVEVDESVKEPNKKPKTQDTLDGDEAMQGKTAADLGNEMLQSIRDYQGVKVDKKAEAQSESKEAESEEDGEGNDKKAESDEGGSESDGKKANKPLNMELTQDVLAKMAAITLSTDEGAEFMQKTLSKTAGAQAAEEMIGFVAQQEKQARKQAAEQAGAQDASNVIGQLRKQAADQEKLAYYNKGKEDARRALQGQTAKQAAPAAKQSKKSDRSVKLANAIRSNIAAAQKTQPKQAKAGAEQDEYVKLGQAIADASIEEALGGAGGGEMPGGMPAGMPAAPAPMPEEGGAPAEGGGIEDFSEEEIEAALEQLIAEGVITEDDVKQVIALLTGEAGEAGEAGGEGGAPEGEPAQEAPKEEPPKEPAQEGGEGEPAEEE